MRGQVLPGLVVVPRAAADLGRCGQLAVDADVDDDARRAQRLRVEHAEVVGRVVEEAEVGHQLLGVERPALAVAADPGAQPTPAVEQVAPVDRLRDLQVMAGDALVVDGGEFRPRAERGLALGHRPPHPSRTGDHVVARAGVVDAARVRRRDPALQPADRARGCRSGCRPARRWRRRTSAASTPAARRCPRGVASASSSRNAIASVTDAPGLIRSAVCSICSVMRATSAWPHCVRLVQIEGGARRSGATRACTARARRRPSGRPGGSNSSRRNVSSAA